MTVRICCCNQNSWWQGRGFRGGGNYWGRGNCSLPQRRIAHVYMTLAQSYNIYYCMHGQSQPWLITHRHVLGSVMLTRTWNPRPRPGTIVTRPRPRTSSRPIKAKTKDSMCQGQYGKIRKQKLQWSQHLYAHWTLSKHQWLQKVCPT